MEIVSLLSYVCALLFNVYSLYYFVELGHTMKNSGREKEFSQEITNLRNFEFCFFTLWNFIFQMLFMIVAILDEAAKLLKVSLEIQKKISKTRAVMYNTILFPSSLLVASLFWSIWFIDRDLIFPKVLDVFFPMWLNHMLHTFIILPVIIELLLPKKYYFVKFDKAALTLLVIFVSYMCLYFSIYFRHGVWLYPIYKIMSWPQRGIFSLLQLCLALGYQRIGIFLQNAKRPEIRQKAM